jgi:MFS family permease
MRWPQYLDPLRGRNFRRLYIGQSVSVFGDGLTPVAITFAVLGLTGSATDLGLVLAAQSLPLAALSLAGGVWGDRLRREWVMMISDVIRAAAQGLVALLLLSHSAHIWQLALLFAIYGAAEAFFRPAAGALIPQIVQADQLQEANALMGISENFGWMVGPGVAGILVAFIGPGGAIAIDAATFVVSAGFLAILRAPPLERTRQPETFVHELRDGWREVWSRTWLWTMMLRTGLVLFIVIAPFQVLGPLALRQHGHGAEAWGLITGLFSAGMLLGGALALRYKPRRPMVTVCYTGLTALLAPFVVGMGGGVEALAVAMVLRGVAIGVLVTIWNTTLQREIPDEALARVTAWDWMTSLALWPIGLAIAGPVAEAVGVTNACWLSFFVGAAGAIWALFVKDVWRLQSPAAEPAAKEA